MTYRYSGDSSNLAAFVVIAIIVIAAMFLMNASGGRDDASQSPSQVYRQEYEMDRYRP